MSEDERTRWDERYASGAYTARTAPSSLLATRLPELPRGRALDIATGTGRNAFALARAGFRVDAVDISAVAIGDARARAEAAGLTVAWHVADLDTDALPGDGYDLITVFRYRNPALWPRLVAALAPGGWLLVEHHLRSSDPDVEGPGDPAFRLAPGELLQAFAALRIVSYDERLVSSDTGSGRFAIARLVACAGDPGF